MSNAVKERKEREEEKMRRERERREFKEAQELESLRRAFKRIDKKSDNTIDVEELLEELDYLGHKIKAAEAALTIWEVDDDADGQVNWDEFRTMFYRIRDDQTGYEPRKLFNVVEFLMYDKNFSGSIDLDECMSILYQRFGKAAVDQAMTEVGQNDEANEKSVSFSTFIDIQAKASKQVRKAEGSSLKLGATMVPQVKGLGFGTDPTLSHLM